MPPDYLSFILAIRMSSNYLVPVKNHLDVLRPLGYTKSGIFKCLYIQLSKK